MLYEMLAGDPPYTGSTAQAIVAKVITEKAPPVTAARDTVPPHVSMAIGKALSKLPADRFSTAIRFAEALTNPGFSVSLAEAGTVSGKRVSLWNPLSVAATVVAAVAVALAAWLATRPETAKPVSRFVVNTGDVVMAYAFGQGTPTRLSLTPDGSELVYLGSIPDDGQPPSLLRRPLAQFTAHPIPGTEWAFNPRVSPDGQHVAFTQRTAGGGALKVASLRGGPPVAVLDSIWWREVFAWGPGGYLYFFLDGSTLNRISASGGAIEQVVALQAGVPGASYVNPTILPNGRGAIVTVTSADPNEHWEYQVHLVDLTTGESREAVTGVYGTYTASGHLVYVTAEGTLMAAPLDMDAMVLSGPPVAMFDGVGTRIGGSVDLALSDNGTLAYTTQGTNISERVVWASRDGVTRPVDPAWVREDEFEGLALSPDGTRLAVEVVTDRRSDIWIKRLDEGPLSRLTFGGEDNIHPVWTPDGASVTFLSYREDRLEVWTKRADGSGAAQRLVDLEASVDEISWSPGADWLLLRMDEDIYAMRPGVDSVPSPLVTTEFTESGAVLSPDGRWLAYVSDESGEREIYLRPFPDVDQGRWQLSTAGGREPMWSADGTMLYYRTDGRTIEEIDMRAGPSAATKVSTIHLPTQNVYEQNGGNVMYAVAPDGRFLVVEREGSGDVSGDLVIVQNFFEELKAKAGN
jgi:serine/threonine-protein kinase